MDISRARPEARNSSSVATLMAHMATRRPAMLMRMTRGVFNCMRPGEKPVESSFTLSCELSRKPFLKRSDLVL